jgi:hypothetical protein
MPLDNLTTTSLPSTALRKSVGEFIFSIFGCFAMCLVDSPRGTASLRVSFRDVATWEGSWRAERGKVDKVRVNQSSGRCKSGYNNSALSIASPYWFLTRIFINLWRQQLLPHNTNLVLWVICIKSTWISLIFILLASTCFTTLSVAWEMFKKPCNREFVSVRIEILIYEFSLCKLHFLLLFDNGVYLVSVDGWN